MEAVRLFWEAAWSQGDTDVLAEIFVSEPRENDEPMDVAAFAVGVRAWRERFPDFTATIEELLPVGTDRVLSRVTYRGTQAQTCFGLPSTGRAFEVIGLDLFRLRDGKITDFWHCTDHLDVVLQLGGKVVPASE